MTARQMLVPTLSAVIGLTAAANAFGQTAPAPIALDIFGGYSAYAVVEEDNGDEADADRIGGWRAGATLSPIRRLHWLGFTGSYGSHSNDTGGIREALGGITLTTPWAYGNDMAFRGFAHVLAGADWSRLATGASQTRPLVVVGGGFDALLLRIQFDYVRADRLSSRQREYSRVRGCRGPALPGRLSRPVHGVWHRQAVAGSRRGPASPMTR